MAPIVRRNMGRGPVRRNVAPTPPVKRPLPPPQALKYLTSTPSKLNTKGPRTRDDSVSTATDNYVPPDQSMNMPPPPGPQPMATFFTASGPVPNPEWIKWKQRKDAYDRALAQQQNSSQQSNQAQTDPSTQIQLRGFPGYGAWLAQNPGGTYDQWQQLAQQYVVKPEAPRLPGQAVIHDYTDPAGQAKAMQWTQTMNAKNLPSGDGSTNTVQRVDSVMSNLPGMSDYLANQYGGNYGGGGGGGGGMQDYGYQDEGYSDPSMFDEYQPPQDVDDYQPRYRVPSRAIYDDGPEDDSYEEYAHNRQSEIDDLEDERVIWEQNGDDEEDEA